MPSPKKGNFTGKAIRSNGAEGGNRRVKNAVRVPYARSDTVAGKGIFGHDQGLDLHHQGRQGRGERREQGRRVHVRKGDDGMRHTESEEPPDEGTRSWQKPESVQSSEESS